MADFDNFTIGGAALTPQEKFVLEKVEKGLFADLTEEFIERGKELSLRSLFLELLLTNGFEGFKVHYRGIRIRGAIFEDVIELFEAKLSHGLVLDKCCFKKNVVFIGSTFEEILDLSESTFWGEFISYNITVKKDFFCKSVSFEEDVDLVAANIAWQFSASETIFNKNFNFNSGKVGRSAHFKGALFKRSANFISAEISQHFNASFSVFNSTEDEVNFHAMTVGNNFDLHNAKFLCAANFGRIKVREQFIANNVNFINSNKEISFNNMKVEDSAFFNNTKFCGPINAIGIDIRGQLQIMDACFEYQYEGVTFNSMKIGQHVLFCRTRFLGPVDLGWGYIGGVFNIFKSTFMKINLLEGLYYKSITLKEKQDDDENWEGILAWLDKSTFNLQNYFQLESYCLSCGQKEWGDRIFIKGKRMEWQRRKWHDPGKWLTGFFWDWMSGYGRRPVRIFWISLLAIFTGWCLFDPSYLKQGHWLSQFAIDHPEVVRFTLSLDRFLPGDILGLAKIWEPTKDCYIQWVYWNIQKMLGWILMPIGSAALISRFK